METKQPQQYKFWLLVILGYIVLFVIGFYSPIVLDRVSGGSHNETTKTATTSSESSIDEAGTTPNDSVDTTDEEVASSAESTVVADSAEVASEPVTSNEAEASNEAESSSTSSAMQLTVPQGTTAYSIAKQHGLTVAELQQMNPSINMNALQAGETIVVSR
ncbi:LysM peptidoglycan-binding domain-containing protein [Weissella confusa]|uniref:LysM peptidoglycan-binding domain-containing protein n=1 Tax=Weissella confusa TaxID=1583 RepID=A0AAJ3DC77_WEICO|nr:LysM domain-containing protein [Weissella confusa]MBJ7695227.1 LysM peptidoglycan-binding domain-containing protein [Weissella confusa]NBA11762.1 LysM peptidoglycan-binding domain-containing protein [Weissella confusa]